MTSPVHRIRRRSTIYRVALKRAKFFTIFIFLSGLFFGSNVFAYYTSPKEYEIKQLPYYIQIRIRYFLGDKSPAMKKKVDNFIKTLGPGYRHVHHYGLGLICLNRVYRGETKPFDRNTNLGFAVKEFDYVIKSTGNRRLKILYEVWYKRGEALILQKEIFKAAQSFQQSIKLNPDYFKSYVMLSECYRRLGDDKNAEKILEIGRSRARKKE